MINVNDNFKIDIRTYGRQFDVKLKANNTDISSDYLNYLKPSFNTSLFKTVMHQIEIDSKLYMPADTKITGKIGVKVNEKTYNYINLNNYYVKSCERQEDTNSYRILAYTKMKESMIDYDLTLTEKITVRNYLIKICQRLGWNTSNIPTTFINSEKLVDPSLHTGINYSFRDALDELATITCSFLMFKGDEFYLLYLTETNESIDETYLDEDNITIGEKYIINSLVFSRAEESDNIFRKDDTSIATNGLHEYRISDCQLLSTNDRSDYIDEMFNYLKALSFYIFDVQSKGILFLEACDIFNFVLNEVTYKTILLNNEIELDDGLTEKLYTDEPEGTETEYKYADSTDKKINQAYILVDKQNKKIIQKVSSVEQSVENITNTEGTATGKSIHLEDSSDEPLVSIKVKGETNQATRSGKNKCKITISSQTKNGLDVVVNADKTILINGTPTANTLILLSENFNIPSGTYCLSGCPQGGSSSTYKLYLNGVSGQDLGEGKIITLSKEKNTCAVINISEGVVCNNLLFKPQLEIGSTATDYEAPGVSPSLDCSSPIENVEGKNKFNKKTDYLQLYMNITTISQTEDDYIGYIRCKPNTHYSISKAITYAQGFYVGSTEVMPAQSTSIINGLVSSSATKCENYKTPSNAKYLVFRIGPEGNGITLNEMLDNIQVEEGQQATPYVPYNSLEIKDVGENLLNVTAKTTTVQGLTFTVNEDKSITINGTNTGNTSTGTAFFRLADNFILPAGDYTLSNKNANASVNSFLFYDDSYNFVTKNISNATFKKDTTIKPYIKVKAGATVNNQTIYPMILKGAYTEETMPAYKPYQEQKVTFPLGNQKLMKDSYLASGGIQHNRKQVILGDITSLYSGTVLGVECQFAIYTFPDAKNTGRNYNFVSDRISPANEIFGQYKGYRNAKQLLVLTTADDTVENFNSKISGSILEYELSEPETVPYTAEQQEAWDKIEQLHTYKNVTNIFSDAELDIVYARDNGLSDMYETKQNAERNYTKTTEKLADQKMTVDGVITQVSDITSKTDELTGEVKTINSEISTVKQTIEGWSSDLKNTGGNNIFYYSLDFWDNSNGLEEYSDTEIIQNSLSQTGYALNNGSAKQTQSVKNGFYTCSFNYKKLLELAVCQVKINGITYDLTETDWAEFEQAFEVTTNVIEIEFISDTDSSLYISDLMINVGKTKLSWSQNANETRTDTVTIGKGIQVNSSAKNTYHRIDADGNRTFNKTTGKVVNEATDKGTETEELVVRGQAKVSGLLIQKVSDQVWINSLL